MTVSKIRLNGTDHDIRAKYLIQSTSSDATSAEFSARTVTEDAIANIQKIYGNTYKWNQLAKGGSSTTITYDTTTNTYSSTRTGSYAEGPLEEGQFIAGHVYYGRLFLIKDTGSYMRSLIAQAGGGSKMGLQFSNINGVGTYTSYGTSTDSGGLRVLFGTSGTVSYDISFRLNIFDLTLMYGSGSEPTASEFEAQYPASYYPYDPGSLVSNSATTILSRGFNQFDDSTLQLGKYRQPSGVDQVIADRRSSDEFFSCLPDTDYYLGYGGSDTSYGVVICWYDASQNYITGTNRGSISTYIHHSPSNAAYFKISSVSPTGWICINISDPAKNGTYEPYNGHQIDLGIPTLTGKLNGAGSSVVIFSNGMQLNGTTRDELTATSAIKRIADDNSVLSTPQTYILDNALQLQYPVVAGGTEMVLPTSGTAPMKMDVIYGNAADAAANMSQNFISVDSMKEFLAALGTQMGGTWSMGYENGKHTFTFTSN